MKRGQSTESHVRGNEAACEEAGRILLKVTNVATYPILNEGIEHDHTPGWEDMPILSMEKTGDRVDKRRFTDFRPAPVRTEA